MYGQYLMDLYILSMTGLVDLIHRDSIDDKIEAFLPGYYETYNILSGGEAVLHERKRFHKIGNVPLYKTIAPAIGKCCAQQLAEMFYS